MAQTRLAIARFICGVMVGLMLLGCEGGGESRDANSAAVLRSIPYRLTTDHLYSQHVEDRYPLLIYLPPGYDTSNRNYPVVYALDMAFQDHQQAFDAILPTLAQEVVIVGIGNHLRRDRDYTPDRGASTPEGHGGAANFYNFLVYELVPHIDANYHTDPTNRTLAGHGYGGLFTLFALFSEEPEPRHFNAFIASSPWIQFAPQVLADMEASMYERSRDLPVTLHLSAGLEGTLADDCHALAAQLVSRGYDGLLLMKSEFPVSHIGNIAPSYRQGLQLVYGVK